MSGMTEPKVFRCPACDGRLEFDIATGKLRCTSCGGETEIKPPKRDGQASREADGHGDGDNPDTEDSAASTPHATTDEDFFLQSSWDDGTDELIQYAVRHVCPSCAAEMVTDASVVSTECPYCGNAMTVSGSVGTIEVPDTIVPFTITKDRAKVVVRKYLKERHQWLPSDFSDEATLEHIKAVYVPYYRFDLCVSGWISYVPMGSGCRIRVKASQMDFAGIPADGSSKMPDAFMDALEPFAWNLERPFSAGYIAGLSAEVPDEDTTRCMEKPITAAIRTFGAALMDDTVRTDNPAWVSATRRTVDSHTETSERGHSVTLLPVWIMHYRYEEQDVLVCVNGNTEKCVGNLPIDRRIKVDGSPMALSVCIGIALFMILAYCDVSNGFVALIFTVLLILFPITVTTISEHHKKIVSTMDESEEMREADAYVTREGLVVTDMLDSAEHFDTDHWAMAQVISDRTVEEWKRKREDMADMEDCSWVFAPTE